MASTRLTNDDRNTAVSNALRATFQVRIEQQKEALTQHAIKHIKAMHPIFVEMKKDPERRKYMYIHEGVKFRISQERADRDGKTFVANIEMRMPIGFGHIEEHLREEGYRHFDGWKEVSAPAECPSGAGMIVLESGHPLAVQHFALWDEYFSAQDALRETLYNYVVREKFEEDFPELAQYLPARRSPVRAVTVPVGSLRAKLSAVGVPPSAGI